MNVLIGSCSALGERNSNRIELLLEPTDTNAKINAPTRECIKGCDLFGEHYRISLGEYEYPCR